MNLFVTQKFSASNADSNWLWAPISFIVWIFTIIKEFMLRSFSSNTPQEPRSRCVSVCVGMLFFKGSTDP